MKGNTNRMRFCTITGLLLLTLAFGSATLRAGSTPFTHVYSFGDSLTDVGRFYELSGGVSPSPQYFQGRYSNGKLWVEYLVEALGMEPAAADNYAVGGAMTGWDNYRDGLAGRVYPGLQDEVSAYVGEHSLPDADGALFVVWAGANDVFYALERNVSPNVLIGQGVVNTLTAVQRLRMAGARHIMVIDLPDLGLTPLALSLGAGPNITMLSAAYNTTLNQALDALEQAGISTIRVPSSATIRQMVENPAAFGFENVTTPAIGLSVDPDSYLFWDPVHPTTRGHAVLAQAAVDALVSYYSPSNGKGLPPARVNALNGLVQAAPRAVTR